MMEFSLDKFPILNRIVDKSGTKWLQVKFGGEVRMFCGAGRAILMLFGQTTRCYGETYRQKWTRRAVSRFPRPSSKNSKAMASSSTSLAKPVTMLGFSR